MPRKAFKLGDIGKSLMNHKAHEAAEQALINAGNHFARAGRPELALRCLEIARDSVTFRIEVTRATMPATEPVTDPGARA